MAEIVEVSRTSTLELQNQLDDYKEKNRRELVETQRQLKEKNLELEKARLTSIKIQEEVTATKLNVSFQVWSRVANLQTLWPNWRLLCTGNGFPGANELTIPLGNLHSAPSVSSKQCSSWQSLSRNQGAKPGVTEPRSGQPECCLEEISHVEQRLPSRMVSSIHPGNGSRWTQVARV